MHIRLSLSIGILLYAVITLHGQCLQGDSLWKRLVFLRNSPGIITPDQQLKELLTYEGQLNKCSYRNDSVHALLKQRIGAMYFYRADYISAALYMKQAIGIINNETGKPYINVAHNIRNYFSLAWIYDSLNNVTGKIKALDSCATVAIRLGYSDFYCVSSLNDLTEYSYDMGDYHRCIEYAGINERIAREYSMKCSDKMERLTGIQFALRSSLLKVNALFMLQDYITPEKILIEAIAESKKNDLKGYLGTIYQQLAKIEIEKGNERKALINYAQALKYEKEAGDNIGCKAILNLVGHDVYYERFHDLSKALLYCRKAFSYINKDKFENITDAFVSLNILTNIGQIYAGKGMFDTAFNYYQLAFNQIKPGMNEQLLVHISADSFAKNKSIHYLSKLLITKGDTYVQLFKVSGKQADLLSAVQIYKITDGLLSRIKSEQKDLESKLFWKSDAHTLYEKAIEACYLLKNPSDAFYFFEKSRATLLTDQLTEQQTFQQSDIMTQSQLKKNYARLIKELEITSISSERYSAVQTEIMINKQDQDHLVALIKERNPLYYQSFLDTNFITIKDVRHKLLKERQVLMELFIGDSTVYTLLITQNQVLLNLIKKHDFDSTVARYTNFLSDPKKMNTHFDDYLETASHLNKLIFKDNDIPPGRIIISQGGKYFPFEALITSSRGQPVRYFLTDHATSYTYSARFLLNDFSPGVSGPSENFLGVAPVNYPASLSLASLTGSENSLQNISGHLSHSLNLLSANATRYNFQKQFYQYKMIQLYTHATDNSAGKQPVIYFSDSALYLSDLLAERKIFTKLIVLSACKTGLGREYKGEGIFSFNRGFAVLGIPSSVTNLWSIDNVSTYRLTELFYKYLSQNLPLDIALQKAKLEFISTAEGENALPYYWAAPILVGKTDPIIIAKPFAWKYIILSGISLAAIIFFVLKNLRKRNSPTPTPGTTQTAP